jgi:hypothetical protein
MTEAQWLACGDAWAMLDSDGARLLGRAYWHHHRHYVCACCRRLAPATSAGDLADAVAVTERFTDRRVGAEEFTRFRRRLEGVDSWPLSALGCAVCAPSDLPHAAWRVTELLAAGGGHPAAERAGCAALVRDIFGNPFRPVVFPPEWRTSDVRLLAKGIYEERAFDRMPILADALQDAGCDDEEVLAHCRDEGPHVRGCWVVDLVLGQK